MLISINYIRCVMCSKRRTKKKVIRIEGKRVAIDVCSPCYDSLIAGTAILSFRDSSHEKVCCEIGNECDIIHALVLD